MGATTTTIAVAARNSSLSLVSNSSTANGGGILASRQSFLSTASSRRTSGLYQHNLEDDSSTGSHLYFMGGEVVVHRHRSRSPETTSNTSNGNSIHSNNNHFRGISPSNIPRGNSFSGAIGETEAPTTTAVGAPPSALISRNESNFSLLSSASDAYHNTIGLDVTGRGRGSDDTENDPTTTTATNTTHPFYDGLPNDTSMETVEASNASTPQKPQQHNPQASKRNSAVADATAASDNCYAQESGGLRAIFENKLTPRHRNTHHAQRDRSATTAEASLPSTQQQQQQQQQNPSTGVHYQRRPPTFPELVRQND
mmetsp:Transcript_27661/g.57313  ORF Transcript_27661/g.57313 Transcript_27661/m.57313 type:complete len:312 (-) Transcript_27661:2468-3403(-)